MSLQTDIIILSYKDSLLIDRCIMSVLDFCKDFNLIIINNNRTNLGFSRGVNKGLRMSKAPFVWLLNSDAFVCFDAMNSLLQLLKNQHNAGIVASKQVHPKNPDIITYGGSGQCWPHGIHLGGMVSNLDCSAVSKQIWLNFASVMIKREVIEKVGLLDESMFLIYSDADYSLRCRDAGYDLWYCPHSKVFHTLNCSKDNPWLEKDRKVFEKKWLIDQPEKFKILSQLSGSTLQLT